MVVQGDPDAVPCLTGLPDWGRQAHVSWMRQAVTPAAENIQTRVGDRSSAWGEGAIPGPRVLHNLW